MRNGVFISQVTVDVSISDISVANSVILNSSSEFTVFVEGTVEAEGGLVCGSSDEVVGARWTLVLVYTGSVGRAEVTYWTGGLRRGTLDTVVSGRTRVARSLGRSCLVSSTYTKSIFL